MVIVSACLVGLKTRHDGQDALHSEVYAQFLEGGLLPLCPEQLGGLPTPRPKAEIDGGDGEDVLRGRARVISLKNGQDLTSSFLLGAQEVLKVARSLGVKKAYMKDRSPTCAPSFIYRKGELVPGRGVCSALLRREGIELVAF